jgi:hypothetical protein
MEKQCKSIPDKDKRAQILSDLTVLGIAWSAECFIAITKLFFIKMGVWPYTSCCCDFRKLSNNLVE